MSKFFAKLKRQKDQFNLLRQVEIVRPFVDNKWYYSMNPDVAASKMDASKHFVRFGVSEYRDPHPLFSTLQYLERYPAVRRANINPLVHFLTTGTSQGYDPHPLISTQYIRAQTGSTENVLLQYLDSREAGILLRPHQLFDVEYYQSQCNEIDFRVIDPLIHYLNFGSTLGLDPSPYFSTNYYLVRYADVKASNVNPLIHYIVHGSREGRDPHPAFDARWYREKYMGGLPETEIPLVHFVTKGLSLDAIPHPLFPVKEYRAAAKDKLAVDQHPLTHALETKKLQFTFPTVTVDNPTTLQKKRYELETFKATEAFVVFNTDAISGGIFSIFSIAKEIRATGGEAALFSLPGGTPIVRYMRFNNAEIISPFEDLIEAIVRKAVKRIHIPEVLMGALEAAIIGAQITQDLRGITLNILNQNGTMMPDRSSYAYLSSLFQQTTMTTAHERYSTHLHSDLWGVPIKHISTYVSYDDYEIVDFKSKKNMIILSVDRMIGDEDFLDKLSNSYAGYMLYRIQAVHYEMFKFCIGWSKFTITFGEGLDNYFIETVFTGGIPFAVFNSAFMPESMKILPNVFRDLSEMNDKLPSLMRDIEMNADFRKHVQNENYQLLAALYDQRIYKRKLGEFLLGQFDAEPRT